MATPRADCRLRFGGEICYTTSRATIVWGRWACSGAWPFLVALGAWLGRPIAGRMLAALFHCRPVSKKWNCRMLDAGH